MGTTSKSEIYNRSITGKYGNLKSATYGTCGEIQNHEQIKSEDLKYTRNLKTVTWLKELLYIGKPRVLVLFLNRNHTDLFVS